jgi:butyrate kinase
MFHILTINPGSTSTKIAIFKFNNTLEQIVCQNIDHDGELLKKHKDLTGQVSFWIDYVIDLIKVSNISKIDCIVSRGGIVKPVTAGSYVINSKMLDDLSSNRFGTHASNLGALIADGLSKKFNCEAMIVDPVGVDEFTPLARYSGFPGIERRSLSHALNIRAMTRLAVKELNLKMEEANFVVAHLGGGISIVSLQQGRIVDTNNANDGGPFSPQRAGSLPITQLVSLAYSGLYKTAKELIYKLTRESGLLGYLGTNNGKEIIDRIASGDKKAEEVFRAMGYQIAKEIGAMATVLKGEINTIIIVGGLARPPLVDWIKESVAWIAPVIVYPGERELEALAEAGARFLSGEEKLKDYV